MLKMTVRPLAIRNSSIPYNTPLSADMTISSSTTHHPWKEEPRLPPAVAGANDKLRDDQSAFQQKWLTVTSLEHAHDQFGRVILQVVARTVCSVSICATTFQPQPVFSSSNGSPFVNSPNDTMYIG